MGIFPPACKAAAILAGSMGGDGLMVATSKAGLVWAKAAMAVNARPIVIFLIIRCISFKYPSYSLSEARRPHPRPEPRASFPALAITRFNCPQSAPNQVIQQVCSFLEQFLPQDPCRHRALILYHRGLHGVGQIGS